MLAALLIATPAIAKRAPPTPPPVPSGTLIENVDGLTPDGKGGIERFDAFLIDAQGRVAQVFHKGEKHPQYVSYKLDGKGRVVVPGMIDAHGHVQDTGFAKMTLDLSAAKSVDEALSRISAYAAAHPDNPWILGRGWSVTTLGRMPTAAELDRATGGRPAWLVSADGHSGWANSAALAAANVNAATPDPAGGAVLRVAASKAPAGVLVETAMALVEGKVPRPRPEDRDTAFAEAQLALLASGVTTVADMGTTIEDWQVYRRAADKGALRIRIVAYAGSTEAMSLIGGPGPSPWLYDDRLKMNGVALTLDGGLESRGGWLKAPYADDAKARGLPRMNQTQLGNLMSRAAMDRFQVTVDATGDEATSTTLGAIDDLSATYKGDRRWRIEGADVVDPADIARFGRNGVIVSMQPQALGLQPATAQARLGAQRLTGTYAWKSIAATGARLAFGSGTPAAAPRPFEGLALAIDRQGWQPQEALTREAALAAYTTGAAYALFAEDRLGRIATGYRADFLFLDSDPMLATPDQVKAIRVGETWIGGQRAWAAPVGADAPAATKSPVPAPSTAPASAPQNPMPALQGR